MKKATGILIIVILLMVAGFGVWLYLQELDRQQLPPPPDPGQQTTKKPDPKPDPPKPPEKKPENYAIFTMGMPSKKWSMLSDEEYAKKYPKPRSMEFHHIHGYYKERNEKFPYVIYLIGTKEKQSPEDLADIVRNEGTDCESWFRVEIEYIKTDDGKIELYLVEYRMREPPMTMPWRDRYETDEHRRNPPAPDMNVNQIEMKINGKMAPGKVIGGYMNLNRVGKDVFDSSVKSSKIRFRCKLEPFPDD